MAYFSPKDQSDSAREFARISLQEEMRSAALKEHRYSTIVASIKTEEEEEDEESKTLHGRALKLLESTPFQVMMASCIMLNAAVIGGETDYPDLPIWHFVETAFLLIFSIELLLRMCATGIISFFAPGEDQLWNLFDFGIVGLGIFDFVVQHLHPPEQPSEAHGGKPKENDGGVATLFRMIRLLRILRIFKIVRFLKQLYMLAFGFVEAIQAICWVSVLMFCVLYICSIVMVKTYGRHLFALPEDKSQVLTTQFGSISASMLSLFELMSNPGNLGLYHILMNDFPMLTLFLIAFVIFGSFGMIALLTGVISESMFEKNQTRAAEERQEREQKRELLKEKCEELFASVTKDEFEESSPEELEGTLPFVKEMFDKLDIEYMEHEIENILSFCDPDGSGSISETEFVSGILSLCDGVRAASIQEVYYLTAQMSTKVKKMDVLHDEIRYISENAIPELQLEMKKILQKLEIQPLSAATPSKPIFDTSFLNQSPEAKASLASAMNQQTELISRKIDDLKASIREICRGPESSNGSVPTTTEVQMGKQKSLEFESTPSMSKVPSLKQKSALRASSKDGLRDRDKRIAPLAPPHSMGGTVSPPQSTGGTVRIETRP